MEDLKSLKKKLICLIEEQMNGDIRSIDAKELGEVVDMVKDLAETMYYCSISEAMEDASEEEKEMRIRQYTPGLSYSPIYFRDMDRNMGKMYYTEPWYDPISEIGRGNNMHRDMRDSRDGKSYASRRTYMTMKENGVSTQEKSMELERYIKELGEDIVDMLDDATPEERNIVKQKLATLVNKM